MVDPNYDPQKRRDYYLRTRQLKGRHSGSVDKTLSKVGAAKPSGHTNGPTPKKDQQAKVVRLTEKLHRLQSALKDANEALRKAKAKEHSEKETAKETAKKNSDGKTTVKERRASQNYRDKHQAELKSKDKVRAESKSKVDDGSVQGLEAKVQKIKALIGEAKAQIKKANSLSHSDFTIDNNYPSSSGRSTVNTK